MTQNPRATRPETLTVVVADDITTTHPGRPLDAVIADVLEGFAARRAAFLARNPDERAYLESEDDHTIWRGQKLVATVRAAPGGTPEVTRLDGPRPAKGMSEDEAEARLLPWDVTDRAIGRWREADRERDEAYRAAGEHVELEKWTGLATSAAIGAERQLLAAILAWSGEFKGVRTSRPTKYPWPARGVLSCGKLYLAIPDPNRDGGEGGGEVDVMQLAVVEMSAVVNLDDCPDVAPIGEA